VARQRPLSQAQLISGQDRPGFPGGRGLRYPATPVFNSTVGTKTGVAGYRRPLPPGRQRPLIARIGRFLTLGLIFCHALASTEAANKTAPEASKISVGTRPYAIRAHVSFGPSARVDGALRSVILDDWLGLIRRFVGAPWKVDAVNESPSLAVVTLDSLVADQVRSLGEAVDKVWVIAVRREGPTLILEGREFDVATGRVGEVHRSEVREAIDLPRGLLRLARSLFEPVADVGEQKTGGVSFQIQGGAIDPANSIGAVAPVGTVFRAFRLFLQHDGSVAEVREIPYSYFRVEARDGATARCSIIKGVGDPLTGRYARKNKVIALGIQPSMAPTRLRFVLKADRSPAAGYKLVARSAEPEAKSTEVGITDREGRVELPGNFAEGLVIIRVLAGNNEPMADLPVMPGETRTERTIVFEGRPKTLDLEAKLDALRDAIIDVVATRSRLEARIKARLEGEEWAGFAEAVAEFHKLPPRDGFATQLNRLRADAEQLEAETKTLILTKNARAELDETQALIDRYLDDDTVRALEEAAASAKADKATLTPKSKSNRKKP